MCCTTVPGQGSDHCSKVGEDALGQRVPCGVYSAHPCGVPVWSYACMCGTVHPLREFCVPVPGSVCQSGVVDAYTGFVCAYMGLCMSVWGCAHMYGALPIWCCACPTGIYMCLFRIVHTCLELCVLFWDCASPSRVVSACPELCMYIWGCECLSGVVCFSLGLWVHIQTMMCMLHRGLGTHIWSACL